MNSKLFTKKAWFVLLGIVLVLIISMVLLNIFLIRPAVERDLNYSETIEVDGKEIEIPRLERKKTDDGYFYYILATDEGDIYVELAGYDGEEKNIVLPSSIEEYPVKAVGESQFMYNETVESVEIPNTVQILGGFAFAGCTNLKQVIIPSSVTEIGFGIATESKNMVIYGEKDSYVQEYAKENKIPFQEME